MTTMMTSTTAAAARDGESANRQSSNDRHRLPSCPRPCQCRSPASASLSASSALSSHCVVKSLASLSRCIVVSSHHRVVVSSCHYVVVVVIAGLHRLRCRYCTCLRHRVSRCCCCQRRRCSPLLMVGCCVAYSVVCLPVCHPPLLLLRDRQHFCRRPPPAVPYRRPSPAAVLSITFTAPVDGWLLRSLPAQQHTN